MAIRPIKRISIGDQVLEQLKEQILTGEWKPGDKLPSENELAGRFGVSRVTVRQAMQKLTAINLLETRLGEGSFVKTLDMGSCSNYFFPFVYLGKNSLFEVLEFRRMIEPQTVKIAAERAIQKDIDILESILDEMKACSENETAFASFDLEFHLQIGRMTNNTLLIGIYQVVFEALRLAMKHIVGSRGTSQGIYYHTLILDALKERDPLKSMEIMERHINETYDSMIAGAREQMDSVKGEINREPQGA